ncbi:MAG: hypothetical protein AB1633_06545 [Elusimicrobiota bacterium]
MSKKSATKNSGIITYQLPKPCIAKYLVVVVDRGITSEINHFATLKEAKRAFGKIARAHRYRPSEINGSDYYHVSIWEWTGDRYEDINYYP